jgi:oxygen-dependent protoporphyrinogen oxidase
MPTITVVGAGFSGLATAYFLTKQNFKVRIYEKAARAGGLIQTIRTSHGLVETAANGLRNSRRLEEMCSDIRVPLEGTRKEGRRRFIFRNRPKQVPLRLSDIFRMALRFGVNARKLRPEPFETIAAWGKRVIGEGATDYLLTPALGGIYAGDSERLSANLIFGRGDLSAELETRRPEKAQLHGTVAPPDGMQQLIDGLQNYLERAGVEFCFNQSFAADQNEPTVICLPASAAANCLAVRAPEVSESLRRIEMLSLATVTCFYPREAARLNGFGCLFPRDQGFRARGVLFNNSIFDRGGVEHSETWIFGGALDPDVINLTDAETTQVITGERARFYGRNDAPLEMIITRWPKALPHYSTDLERILTELPALPRDLALVGNYLGKIGLAKILERAAFVAENWTRAL